MDKIDALKQFNNTFKNLSDELIVMDEISNYYDDEVIRAERLDMKSAYVIYKYVNELNDIYNSISIFLDNKIFLELVKNTEDNNFDQVIGFLNDGKIKCGLLLEKYNKYISSNANLFEAFVDKDRLNSKVKYEDLLKQQFRDSKGYNIDTEYSIIKELFAWQQEQHQIGSHLIEHLNIYKKGFKIKPAEINKGLYDSLFYSDSSNNWQIITPFCNTFGNNKYHKGELVYNFGLQIKDENRYKKIPSNIDTIVLYNPYNEKDIKDILNASYDLNVVFSIFGSMDEKNYDKKLSDYYDVLDKLKESDKYVDQTLYNKDKSYVKTIYCGKTK